MSAQNTFIRTSEKHRVDMKNPGLWMHSVKREDTNSAAQTLTVFAIAICAIIVFALIIYAGTEYTQAYGSQKVAIKK